MNLHFLAMAEAAKFTSRYVGTPHMVLALVSEPSAAAEALIENGVTYDRVAEVFGPRSQVMGRDGTIQEDDGTLGTSLNPDARSVWGRAEGLALARGFAEPQPEDWLVALLYSPNGAGFPAVINLLQASRPALVESMRQRGIHLPDVDLPPHTRPYLSTRHS